MVGYLGKELANRPFKASAGHFNRDPVVISKGIKKLEKRILEDEAIAATITMLSGAARSGLERPEPTLTNDRG